MATHAKLSPSSSKRWITCPGSVALIDSLNITEAPNKYAAEGSVAHWLGEESLVKKTSPENYKGKIKKYDGFNFTVNDNMIEAVQVYVDHIGNITTLNDSEDWEGQFEVKCSLKELNVPGMDGGTSDALHVNRADRVIVVTDYKHGQGVVVDPIDNTQLMSYGLGALLHLGISEFDDTWTVFLEIVQPRAFSPDGPIRIWEITSDELFDWSENTLIPAGIATQDPNAPLVPSEEGCRWCPAKGSCKAVYDLTVETAMLDFDAQFPCEVIANPNLLKSQEKAKLLEYAGLIEQFIKAVRSQVESEMHSGSKDYRETLKLVRAKTQRRLNGDALDDFSDVFDHLERGEVFIQTPTNIPMGQIEKLLQKKIGKEDTSEIMKTITTKPEGAIVMVPLSDSRKAIPPSAVSDFADLD